MLEVQAQEVGDQAKHERWSCGAKSGLFQNGTGQAVVLSQLTSIAAETVQLKAKPTHGEQPPKAELKNELPAAPARGCYVFRCPSVTPHPVNSRS